MQGIEFKVYGIPQPQGSTKAFIPKGWTRPIITSDNKKNKPWRQDVSGAALVEMQKSGLALMEGVPIVINVTFVFDRPKSLKKGVTDKITKPDIDKLLRSVLDALTGIVFKDDSQVVLAMVEKVFGDQPGACISVRERAPLGSLGWQEP
jgi:crossover junction endodeoxyribonuclease RusA